MAQESDIRVDSEGTVVAEHTSLKKKEKKKKKNRENKDSFSGEVSEKEGEKLGDDSVVKKKRVDSEAEDCVKESKKKKNKEKRADFDSEAKDSVEKSKKENEEVRVDSEVDDVGKTESGGDVNNDDVERKLGKRKLDGTDLGDEENREKSNKEIKKKRKKMKPSVDPEVEETNKDTTNDAVKEKNQDVGSGVEEKDLNNSVKDGEKKKRKKKKKLSEDAEAGENNDDGAKDVKKKRKKKSKSDEDVTTPSSSKSNKKVKFSDQVEVFPSEDKDSEEEEEEDDDDEVKLVRGKRFTKEEDALVKKAVLDYIDNHALGDEGLEMVMNCKSYPQIKGCWKEIESALPWRARSSVYYRAHNLFEEGSKGVWTKEDLELVKEFQAKHGNDWRTLGDAMGKHRIHVKDAWRRIRLNMNKGHWSREEYQALFDLVNTDIKMKAFKEKHSKHGMLRDNIPWMAISDKLGTRGHVHCCEKWYNQLTSPMVKQGIWANVDDYRLLDELTNLDAACIDDVEWDNLLENRDGYACRKRWNQMVLHIGSQESKTFAEQVEILSQRYCPDLAEDREDFDNRPFDPED
ncbi:hypothetical protein AALP_AA6G322500 [Arabis alpina]|uniref:Myb-like domain-containing protein n=1 Tax=Arabis alpina TaxID=50452 RepID=A0A087GT36_ARAAL|nr:hypothetical protein AALP_AA6G322500 [Arabis alpina]